MESKLELYLIIKSMKMIHMNTNCRYKNQTYSMCVGIKRVDKHLFKFIIIE